MTLSVWEFDPTRPDSEEEFEVFMAENLGDSAKSGYLSFKFEKGTVTSVDYKSKSGEVIASYPSDN